MNNDFKSFMKSIMCFLIPLSIIFFVLEFFLINLGEITSIDKVVDKQLNDSRTILFGRKVVDQELRKYKFKLLNSLNAHIYAIGSSRILSFREEFFMPYYSFVNLGSIAHNLGDVQDLADRMPKTQSEKVVFLGLDYYWFGENRSVDSDLTKDLKTNDVAYDWRAHVYAMRYILKAIFSDYSNFKYLYSNSNIYVDSFGIQGKQGNGYRKDGSYLYTSILNELSKNNVYRDREQPPIIDRIKEGSGSYSFNNDFDYNRLNVLDKILKTLKSKNYYVIGVNLPLSTEVFSELNNNKYHKNLFSAFTDEVPKVFSKNNLLYFDYSNLKSIDLDDTYMFDGVHSSETAAAVILRNILKKVDSKYIPDKDKIRSNLNTMIESRNTTSYKIDLGR